MARKEQRILNKNIFFKTLTGIFSHFDICTSVTPEKKQLKLFSDCLLIWLNWSGLLNKNDLNIILHESPLEMC